jgi:hypothetical protein
VFGDEWSGKGCGDNMIDGRGGHWKIYGPMH